MTPPVSTGRPPLSTQAQSSWAGDGFSTPASFIEESFTSCANDPEGSAAPVATSDLCYNGPILTLSLGGQSSQLVWDATKQVWRAQHDDGSVISQVVFATGSGTGDKTITGTESEYYWKVTDRSGTTYLFGRNRLPGWVSGNAVTNSVQTVPRVLGPLRRPLLQGHLLRRLVRHRLPVEPGLRRQPARRRHGVLLRTRHQLLQAVQRRHPHPDTSATPTWTTSTTVFKISDGNAYGTAPNRCSLHHRRPVHVNGNIHLKFQPARTPPTPRTGPTSRSPRSVFLLRLHHPTHPALVLHTSYGSPPSQPS